MRQNIPWWWIDGIQAKNSRPGKSSHEDQQLQGRRRVIFSEEIIREKSSDPSLTDDEHILSAYKSDREDIRAIIPPILQSSGFLLSLSLGAVYFILKDGHEIAVGSTWIIPLLIAIAVLFVAAILFGVWALYKRPPSEGVTRKDRVEHERRSRNKDRLVSMFSVGAMIFAIIGILVVLMIFWDECNRLNMDSNSSENTRPLVVVLVMNPNYTDTSGIGINDSVYESIYRVGSARSKSK